VTPLGFSNITKENFHCIIEKYQKPIFKYCYHMLRNREEAEDIVQEVFLNAYSKRDKYKVIDSISSFLYRIAYNQCLNTLKRKKIIQFISLEKSCDIPSDQCVLDIIDEDFSKEITYVLSKLSINEKNVFILRVIEEMDYKQISLILDKKEDAIRKLYQRAKNKIKKNICISEDGEFLNEKVSML
jgi:RNA polymerase sigma-70 factor (ECF subfamily)